MGEKPLVRVEFVEEPMYPCMVEIITEPDTPPLRSVHLFVYDPLRENGFYWLRGWTGFWLASTLADMTKEYSATTVEDLIEKYVATLKAYTIYVRVVNDSEVYERLRKRFGGEGV